MSHEHHGAVELENYSYSNWSCLFVTRDGQHDSRLPVVFYRQLVIAVHFERVSLFTFDFYNHFRRIWEVQTDWGKIVTIVIFCFVVGLEDTLAQCMRILWNIECWVLEVEYAVEGVRLLSLNPEWAAFSQSLIFVVLDFWHWEHVRQCRHTVRIFMQNSLTPSLLATKEINLGENLNTFIFEPQQFFDHSIYRIQRVRKCDRVEILHIWEAILLLQWANNFEPIFLTLGRMDQHW